MIGTNDMAGSAFRRRHTSKPSSFGIMTSSRIKIGAMLFRGRQRFLAVAGLEHLIAVGREPRLQDVAVGLVVVDDQDAWGLA